MLADACLARLVCLSPVRVPEAAYGSVLLSELGRHAELAPAAGSDVHSHSHSASPFFLVNETTFTSTERLVAGINEATLVKA